MLEWLGRRKALRLLKKKQEDEDLVQRKRAMCVRCINARVCPEDCSRCAWRT